MSPFLETKSQPLHRDPSSGEDVGARLVADRIQQPDYHALIIQGLMRDSLNTTPEPLRLMAIHALNRYAVGAATGGTYNVEAFSMGGPRVLLPPVPSHTLVEEGIITNPAIIEEVKVRDAYRRGRVGLPAENRLLLYYESLRKTDNLPPAIRRDVFSDSIIRIQEWFTMTNPIDPTVEADIIGDFALGNTHLGHPEVFFLGERREIHVHAFGAGQNFRIKEGQLGFRLPQGITFREPNQSDTPRRASNEQIAAMLVLFKHSSYPQESE